MEEVPDQRTGPLATGDLLISILNSDFLAQYELIAPSYWRDFTIHANRKVMHANKASCAFECEDGSGDCS